MSTVSAETQVAAPASDGNGRNSIYAETHAGAFMDCTVAKIELCYPRGYLYPGRIQRLNLTVPFTFRRLEGGLDGGLQGGFKGPDLREGFRKHEGGLKGG